jgi:hypothetical protein
MVSHLFPASILIPATSLVESYRPALCVMCGVWWDVEMKREIEYENKNTRTRGSGGGRTNISVCFFAHREYTH